MFGSISVAAAAIAANTPAIAEQVRAIPIAWLLMTDSESRAVVPPPWCSTKLA
jgi:hypothetical protein